MVGLCVFTAGAWVLFGEWTDSERSKEDFFSAVLFRQEFLNVAPLFMWLCWVSFIWEHSPWAVSQPSNLEPFSYANFPSWAALASWSGKRRWGAASTIHLQLYCYFVTGPRRKPDKIFKVFFAKGPCNVCPLSEHPSLCLVTQGPLTCFSVWTETCMWQQHPTFIWKLLSGAWTFHSITNPLNNGAFNILTQPFSEDSHHAFYFFRVPHLHAQG